MMREEQFEVFDLVLTTKAPVFIGSGKNYVKKEFFRMSTEPLYQ